MIEKKRQAAKEIVKAHEARMKADGYDRIKLFLQRDIVDSIDIIANAKDLPRYKLVNDILQKYIDEFVGDWY